MYARNFMTPMERTKTNAAKKIEEKLKYHRENFKTAPTLK